MTSWYIQEQLVTAGNEISIDELKEVWKIKDQQRLNVDILKESSTVTAPILPSQHSIDNISDFKPAESVLDPYMQVWSLIFVVSNRWSS